MKKYRDPDSYKTQKILSMDKSLSPGTNMVQWKAVVKGQTPGKKYVAIVQFFDVSFVGNKRKGFIQAGDELWYKSLKIKANPAKIKCSCPDFRFSFEKQNFDAKGLVGNWRRYTRKTAPKKRPTGAKNPNPDGKDFVNAPGIGNDIQPGGQPGYCKHIHSLFQALKNKRDIK